MCNQETPEQYYWLMTTQFSEIDVNSKFLSNISISWSVLVNEIWTMRKTKAKSNIMWCFVFSTISVGDVWGVSKFWTDYSCEKYLYFVCNSDVLRKIVIISLEWTFYKMQFIASLDIGTTTIRCHIIDSNGQELSAANGQVRYFLSIVYK